MIVPRVTSFVGEIPDLRIPGESWVDQAQDSLEARQLLAETASLNYRDMVQWVFARRPGWDKERADLLTQQVMARPERLRIELQGCLQLRGLLISPKIAL